MVENVSPQASWEALRADPNAVLVDVRTDAEWMYVGIPNLQATGKQPLMIPWQIFPSMQINTEFVEFMRQAGLTPAHKIYFLCRSGVRSVAAANAAIQAGFPNAYNILDGFEGPLDDNRHRGTAAGWKASNLPWMQR